MNCVEERAAREGNVAFQAEQRAATLGRPQCAGIPVELPQSQVHRGGRIRHALLAFPQEAFRAPPPAVLDQQAGQGGGLQGEGEAGGEHQAAMLLP